MPRRWSRQAVRSELMRLLGGTMQASARLDRRSDAGAVQGGPLCLSGTEYAAPRLGAAIAQSVHGAILK